MEWSAEDEGAGQRTSRASGSISSLHTPSFVLYSSSAHVSCSPFIPKLPAAPLTRCACCGQRGEVACEQLNRWARVSSGIAPFVSRTGSQPMASRLPASQRSSRRLHPPPIRSHPASAGWPLSCRCRRARSPLLHAPGFQTQTPCPRPRSSEVPQSQKRTARGPSRGEIRLRRWD